MSTAVEQSTSASWQPAIVRIQNKFQTNVIVSQRGFTVRRNLVYYVVYFISGWLYLNFRFNLVLWLKILLKMSKQERCLTAILTMSKTGKPGASCVVPTLGAVVAVLTDGYWNRTGTRVPVWIPVGYPGFQIPGSPSTIQDHEISPQCTRNIALSCDAKRISISSFVYAWYRSVTDGQTDGPTDRSAPVNHRLQSWRSVGRGLQRYKSSKRREQ